MLQPLDWDDEEGVTKKQEAPAEEPAVPMLQGFTPRILIKGLPVIGVHGSDAEPDSQGNAPDPIAIRRLHIASAPPLPPQAQAGDEPAGLEAEIIEELEELEELADIEALAAGEESVSWEMPDDMTAPHMDLPLRDDDDEEMPDTNRVGDSFSGKETMEMPKVDLDAANLPLSDIRSTMQIAKATLESESDVPFALTKRAPVLDALAAATAIDEEVDDSGEVSVDFESSDVISVAGLMPSSEPAPSESVAIDPSPPSEGETASAEPRKAELPTPEPRRAMTSSLTPLALTSTEPPRRESRWSKFAGISSALVLVAMAAGLVMALLPKTGGLRVELDSATGAAPAKAEIFVDGQKKCDTDPCIIDDLSPGTRTIKVLVPGVDIATTAIAVVHAGETMPIKVTVPAAPQPEPKAEPKAAEPKAAGEDAAKEKQPAPKPAAVTPTPRRVRKPAKADAPADNAKPADDDLDVSGDDIYAD